MLDIKLLNSDAQLNNFKEIGSVAYVPGEDVTLVLRLILSQLKIRYIPASGATVAVTFQTKTGVDLVKAATELDAGDRSMWTVSLSQAETLDIIGQNFTVGVTEGAVLKKGLALNALDRTIIDGDC